MKTTRNKHGKRRVVLRGMCSICGHTTRLRLTDWYAARRHDTWPQCKQKIVREEPGPSDDHEEAVKEASADAHGSDDAQKRCGGWIYPVRRRCETCGATLRDGNFTTRCAPCESKHGRLENDGAPRHADEAKLAAATEVL